MTKDKVEMLPAGADLSKLVEALRSFERALEETFLGLPKDGPEVSTAPGVVCSDPVKKPIPITIHNHTSETLELHTDPETGVLKISLVGGGGKGDGFQTFKSSGEWNKVRVGPEVEEGPQGKLLHPGLLYASILSNLDEYVTLVEPINKTGASGPRLGILHRQIRRQLEELYFHIKQKE